jgi:two-component system OmpR family sensor kinase
MIKSLRTRLLGGLAALIIASCVGAGVWEFNRSFDEAIELQDAILLQHAVPSELQPFIGSINRLLKRIAVMLEHQRRFVALSAHELRTPITAISIQAENVDTAELSSDTRNRLEALKEGVRRTVRLLEQLLTLSKYDYGKAHDPSSVMLDDVVKSVVADFVALASARSIDLGCNHMDAAFVTGDSTALTIMVRNLVDNAVRHSAEGSKINLGVHRDCDHVILSVEDRGPGIELGDLDVVFEPFNRGRLAKGDGTGLGLSIVRRIVDNHRGSICLQNTTSPGATGLLVTVRLPAATSH